MIVLPPDPRPLLDAAGAGALAARITPDAPLGEKSWFGAGGRAAFLLGCTAPADLAALFAALPADYPVLPIGKTSNLLIRDGGIPGLCVRLDAALAAIEPDGDGLVCGGGAADMKVAEHSARAGLAGLEFLSGIPGSVGGAVAMNAGAHGADTAAVLDWAEIVGRDGRTHRLDAAALGFSYRHAALPPGSVVLRARLRGRPAPPDTVSDTIREVRAERARAQPAGVRTGGSTFRNLRGPDGELKAWQLIDAAGCRGLAIGDAVVDAKHCNFLTNTGHARAGDLEALGDEVRRRVYATSGHLLRWEIKRVGRRCAAPS